MDKRPIGVFDSGLGGLTCVNCMLDELPDEKLIYFGDNYDSLFVIDVSEGCRGYNLLNINKRNKNDSKKTGEYYDIDINDHPAIKSAIESDSPDYTFERNYDFPTAGSNYIGCKPIKINGKTRVIIGITYNWDALHSSLHSTIIRTMIISVSGMLLVMGVIILLLYRRAVKPAEKIQPFRTSPLRSRPIPSRSPK